MGELDLGAGFDLGFVEVWVFFLVFTIAPTQCILYWVADKSVRNTTYYPSVYNFYLVTFGDIILIKACLPSQLRDKELKMETLSTPESLEKIL